MYYTLLLRRLTNKYGRIAGKGAAGPDPNPGFYDNPKSRSEISHKDPFDMGMYLAGNTRNKRMNMLDTFVTLTITRTVILQFDIKSLLT